MNTFSNLPDFLDWFTRLLITLAAIWGLFNRLVNHLLTKHHAEAIKPILADVEVIKDSIEDLKRTMASHQHVEGKRGFNGRRGLFR